MRVKRRKINTIVSFVLNKLKNKNNQKLKRKLPRNKSLREMQSLKGKKKKKRNIKRI